MRNAVFSGYLHRICTATMSRPSSLWFRTQNGFWYTKLNGTQHKLSKDKGEARRLLHKLLASDTPTPARAGMTTRKLCDLYLDRTREGKGDRSHANQLQHFTAFCKDHGHRDPAAVRVHHIEEWLAGKDTWGASTKALFITYIKAVFNFGVAQGYLDANPVRLLRRKSTGRRQRVLTPEEKERIRQAGSEHFRDFMAVLEQTGCRPFSEAAKITAADIDWEKGRAVLVKHKNAKKTGRPRLIYFPPALLARLKELAEQHPAGPILRNRLGNPWTADTFNKYVKRVCQSLGIEGVTTYVIRHSWISYTLASGTAVEVVAALAGNQPKVIWSNYNQIDHMHEVLKKAAEKAAD